MKVWARNERTCVYMLGSPTGMTWSSGTSAAETTSKKEKILGDIEVARAAQKRDKIGQFDHPRHESLMHSWFSVVVKGH